MVKLFDNVADMPAGSVTVIVRDPVGAAGSMMNVVWISLLLMTVTPLTVTPDPLMLTVSPVRKLCPERVTLSLVTQVYVEVVLQSCTRTGLLPSSRAYWYWSGGVPLIAVVVQVIVTPAGAGKVVLAANVTIWAI